MGQKGQGWGWNGRHGAGGSRGRGALTTLVMGLDPETGMGQEGATRMELVQPSHSHIPAAR